MHIMLKHLEYFVATAEAGSIKTAAEQVSISAPSISSAMQLNYRQLHIEQSRFHLLRRLFTKLYLSARIMEVASPSLIQATANDVLV